MLAIFPCRRNSIANDALAGGYIMHTARIIEFPQGFVQRKAFRGRSSIFIFKKEKIKKASQ